MKISLEWLRQYLPTAPDALACGDALTMAGLPTENFESHGADTVLDVEVTSNRGDCLSHVGIARELAALLRLGVTEPAIGQAVPRAVERGAKTDGLTVAVEEPGLCPVYTARVIRGVKVGPSPAWMVRRLEACGLRAVNNIVDVTNYVLFELGQPLHTFDLSQVKGNQVIVRRARAGESLTSIDGHVRKLTADMLVIADLDRPVALTGVMGGKDSEVSGATTDVLLESAVFDPLSVRKTSRALQLRSDSSHRFERGIPLSLPEVASARAAGLIVELGGGTVSRELAVAGKLGATAKPLTLRLSSVRRTLGIEVSAEAAADALGRLRFGPTIVGDSIAVVVPPDRLDVNVEIDLVEEVARVIGYEQIPLREAISITVTPPQRPQTVMEKIRSILVASGFFEAITFSFVADSMRDAILPPEAAGLPRAMHGVRKADGSLRPSCLPGLMEAQRRNEAAGTREVRLFEVGSTFYLDGLANLVETQKLALLSTDEPRQLRGVVEQLLATLDGERDVVMTPVQRKGYFRAVEIRWGGKVIGLLGVAHGELSAKLDLRSAPAMAELDVLPLIELARLVPQLRALPRFPAVDRDLSLVVEDSVRFAEIESLIAGLGLANLEACQFVTTYRGKPLEKGKKSVTVKLVFRRTDGTLTAEEADASVQKVVTKAAGALAATLRA